MEDNKKLQLFTISFPSNLEPKDDPPSATSMNNSFNNSVVYLPENIIYNTNTSKDALNAEEEQCETIVNQIIDSEAFETGEEVSYFNNASKIIIENVEGEKEAQENDSSTSKVFLDDDGNIYLLTDTENDDETNDRESDLLSKQIVDTSSENVNILQQYGLTFVEEDSEITDQIVNHPDCELSSASGDVDIETLADVVQALKCKECNFTTLDASSLISHHQESHVKTRVEEPCEETIIKEEDLTTRENITYICSKCSAGLSSIQECREHMIKCHKFQSKLEESSIETHEEGSSNSDKNTVEFDCELEETKSKKIYWLQPKTAKEVRMRLCADRKVKCNIKNCMYRFKTIELMNHHRSCHRTDKDCNGTSHNTRKDYQTPFICAICKGTFRNWPNCSMHLWRSHEINIDLIECPLCKEVHTHSAAKMVQHLGKHNKAMRQEIDCRKCHDVEEEQSPDNKPKCRWYNQKKCEICHKIYANSKSLKIHVQTVHNKLKPFICNVCGHSAAKKHMLQLHMRQHTGEKPFACDICPYKTGDHNTLRKHRMKHTGEKPYLCSLCSYSSIQSGPMKLHYKSAHPDEPTPNCYQHKTNNHM